MKTLMQQGETANFERRASVKHETIGAQVKTAPGGAQTPLSRGLADYEGVD